jgi:hypothetical protein
MAVLGRKPPPNRHLKEHSEMSVNPTNLTSERLPMPRRLNPIRPDTKVLDAYWTPNLNSIKALFLLLFELLNFRTL